MFLTFSMLVFFFLYFLWLTTCIVSLSLLANFINLKRDEKHRAPTCFLELLVLFLERIRQKFANPKRGCDFVAACS
jgi:hypothetical protein